MSDSLNLLAKAICHVDGGGALSIRYSEMLQGGNDQDQDVDADQIKKRILDKLKG